MRILVCGAAGFIGGAIAARLQAAGHDVIRGVRRPSAPGDIAIDYTRDLTEDAWLPRLQGIDAVVNAVGILVEHAGQTFAALHRDAPRALFAACVRAGVRRVVQISALGAERGDTAYFASKRAADEFLTGLPVEWQIVRPALVYGERGGSARFFRQLASLPIVGLPGRGDQPLQPVHIDDLTELVLRLVEPTTPARQCVEAVGAQPVSYRQMLAGYRRAMGFPPALQIPVASALVGFAAKVAGAIPGSFLTPDTWRMLQAGNVGDAAAITGVLGRSPRGIDDFIGSEEASRLGQEALAAWRTPLLRVVLAIVWIVSALTSVFWHPVNDSFALLARVGLTGLPARLALYGAAALDLAFGVATLLRPGRSLWLLLGGLIVGYSAIIALALPEFLTHPFGPILKNLPILAILFLLYAEEKR